MECRSPKVNIILIYPSITGNKAINIVYMQIELVQQPQQNNNKKHIKIRAEMRPVAHGCDSRPWAILVSLFQVKDVITMSTL